ncbi:hypothetical protein JTE90_024072 [Oedothorax gibbosus]|uniref:Uncharacterized protein n=1 Tax=Oedothorax gibbosus TaxID=931172 RepID=A0AAV6U773_9ARAC|nr:hypothetical protein JTE90_024072 [Oedothorax gibbosus]
MRGRGVSWSDDKSQWGRAPQNAQTITQIRRQRQHPLRCRIGAGKLTPGEVRAKRRSWFLYMLRGTWGKPVIRRRAVDETHSRVSVCGADQRSLSVCGVGGLE